MWLDLHTRLGDRKGDLMGIRKPETTMYECDRCGTMSEQPANEPVVPAGWVHIPSAAPEADWFCSWVCVKDYAEKRLRVEEAEAS